MVPGTVTVKLNSVAGKCIVALAECNGFNGSCLLKQELTRSLQLHNIIYVTLRQIFR